MAVKDKARVVIPMRLCNDGIEFFVMRAIELLNEFWFCRYEAWASMPGRCHGTSDWQVAGKKQSSSEAIRYPGGERLDG